MKKQNIDLALPSMKGAGLLAVSSEPESAPDYPTLHLEGETELNLPDSGEITFKFKRKSETHSTDKSGKTRYSCVLEIQKLIGTSGGAKVTPPSSRDKSAESALDSLMKEKQDSAKAEPDDEQEY